MKVLKKDFLWTFRQLASANTKFYRTGSNIKAIVRKFFPFLKVKMD